MLYQVPLVLTPAPEGGYTVTSPLLPELLTEGDSPEECAENARDAFAAVLEIYEDDGRHLPSALKRPKAAEPMLVDLAIAK